MDYLRPRCQTIPVATEREQPESAGDDESYRPIFLSEWKREKR